ncbi:YdhW family putative oxidoreductase system protein [Budviciaceae bacterium BWR-B9]|uniref:YdhW family putative oxidoreductase system protein n=1 Tax=Limnobaculum allomyrinae TaxID=2791986 RepID=A0ABS1INL3_9GAMM|nr:MULTISPECIES: YdhW family putative oxidoreductase system protein [Limnobaculum]MBK5143347.1 YdhW family putative oxidoreductase system protein [Limnobaculum allomyrinae]MBV7691235.1 YdhW family putative oxidoreductase system protein [Limnobaculum sp. M2-1]
MRESIEEVTSVDESALDSLSAESDNPQTEVVDNAKRRWITVMGGKTGSLQQEVESTQQQLAEQQDSPADVVADFIRQSSAMGALVTRSMLLAPPYSMSEQDLTQVLEEIEHSEVFTDIMLNAGTQDDYYYSTRSISVNYANMCVLVVEKDICRTIAQAVRFECETYPRPYKVAMLAQSPYFFEPQQIEAALTSIDTHPDYADIRPVASSDGQAYLFSERFMSYGKAYGLCEWLEVEQFQNP